MHETPAFGERISVIQRRSTAFSEKILHFLGRKIQAEPAILQRNKNELLLNIIYFLRVRNAYTNVITMSK